MNTCSSPNCGRPVRRRGFCAMHYNRATIAGQSVLRLCNGGCGRALFFIASDKRLEVPSWCIACEKDVQWIRLGDAAPNRESQIVNRELTPEAA